MFQSESNWRIKNRREPLCLANGFTTIGPDLDVRHLPQLTSKAEVPISLSRTVGLFSSSLSGPSVCMIVLLALWLCLVYQVWRDVINFWTDFCPGRNWNRCLSKISMGLDWDRSGGQRCCCCLSIASINCFQSVLFPSPPLLFVCLCINCGAHRSNNESFQSPPTPDGEFPKTKEPQMVTWGVIRGGAKVIINVSSAFCHENADSWRQSKYHEVFILTPFSDH